MQYSDWKKEVEAALQALPLLSEADADPAQIMAETEAELPEEGEIPQPLRSAMRYSLLLPGKRLRPILLLASYAMLLENWQQVLPFACAIEMIHSYSLIHDDLPALDNDDMRRGQPTNHRIFGENIAILAGDGLLNMAYETMLSAPISMQKPAQALAAAREISVRAGVSGMIAGQTLDVKLEGEMPKAEYVAYIHKHKTADLLTAPVAAGLLLADATDRQLAAGKIYGENLGLAFQIVDDLLDVVGDAQTMGKATGMDAARGKMTWPALKGVENSRKDAHDAVCRAVDALHIFGEKASFLQVLAQETLVRLS